MPLMDCPACGHRISVEAVACPQCGHPNRRLTSPPPPPPAPAGPRCYACPAPATTRCQACGAPSCAAHLQGIYVQHGHRGGYELRCEGCYSSAMIWRVVRWVVFGLVAALVVLMYAMNRAGRS